MENLRENIFQNFNFCLDDGLCKAGFSEVSDLNGDIRSSKVGIDLSEIFSEQETISSQKFLTITFKRGLANSQSDFFQWMNRASGERRNLSLTLFDPENNPTSCWKLSNTFPLKLNYTTSALKSSMVAIAQLDLAIESFNIEIR